MHPFAETPISMVDARDVAACAAALLNADPAVLAALEDATYDITGPEAVRLSGAVATALSEGRADAVAIEACTIDEFIAPRGLPPPAAASLAGFLRVLATECAEVSSAVFKLTGREATDVGQFVRDHAQECAGSGEAG